MSSIRVVIHLNIYSTSRACLILLLLHLLFTLLHSYSCCLLIGEKVGREGCEEGVMMVIGISR